MYVLRADKASIRSCLLNVLLVRYPRPVGMLCNDTGSYQSLACPLLPFKRFRAK